MAEQISLADLVLEERLAEPSVVAAAVRRAREGVPLALALSDAGVPEVGLAAALRRRLGLPVVELANEPVNPEALAEVTAELAARHLCIPLEVGESHGRKVLRLAMANPLISTPCTTSPSRPRRASTSSSRCRPRCWRRWPTATA